jgi:hypothetical protein
VFRTKSSVVVSSTWVSAGTRVGVSTTKPLPSTYRNDEPGPKLVTNDLWTAVLTVAAAVDSFVRWSAALSVSTLPVESMLKIVNELLLWAVPVT